MEQEKFNAGLEKLVGVIQDLSLARDLESIVDIVRRAARQLTGADGATFVLRDGERCYYVDEDAIAPLWKGKRFPLESCISGWAMIHCESVVIEDIYLDPRIPHDAYRATFVKSLAMVPIRKVAPIGSIGNYWKDVRNVTPQEIRLLELLANATSVAFENAKLFTSLQRQIKLRDEFISMASHELKTPMTPLLIQNYLLERKVTGNSSLDSDQLKKEVVRHVDASTKQITEVVSLVDNMLDASRLRLGRFSYDFKDDVSLVDAVVSVVDQFRASTKVSITIDIDPSIKGFWDRGRIEQIFRNLVSNAIRYGDSKPIEIYAKLLGDRVLISVKDYGIGIARADQERIFERFERAASSRSYGGMGLGLYIVRELVRAHGGSISISSEPGSGSLFEVNLPIRSQVDAVKIPKIRKAEPQLSSADDFILKPVF